MTYCLCHSTLTLSQAKEGLLDEVKEFIAEPSLDEASDIVYCLNRLAGSLVGKPYVRIFPGGKLHIQKIEKRMDDYGCIRSKRHLVFGICPTAFKKDQMYIKLEDWRVVDIHNPRSGSRIAIDSDFPLMTDGIYQVDENDNISYTFVEFLKNRDLAKTIFYINE